LDRAADCRSFCGNGSTGRSRSALDNPIVIRAALVLLAASLAGCAGISTYDIHPYYEPATGQEVCCAAVITSGRDVASATVDVTKTAEGAVTVHYTETGVSATLPIAANAVTASAVAGAISSTAISAAQILH
jgi:hypothetical protein